MRKLLLIVLVFSYIGCTTYEDDLLDVVIDLQIKERVTNSGARIAASVPDFNQRFGEVDLLVTNTVNFAQVQKSDSGDYVRHIELPQGNYDFYMSGDGSQIYNDHLVFTSVLDSVDIMDGAAITLPADTQQALILFYKTALDGPPQISVKNDSTNTYGSISMYDDTNYYYAYVYGSWQYVVDFSVNGNAGVLERQYQGKKIYQYTISGGTILIEEPFDEVIANY